MLRAFVLVIHLNLTYLSFNSCVLVVYVLCNWDGTVCFLFDAYTCFTWIRVLNLVICYCFILIIIKTAFFKLYMGNLVYVDLNLAKGFFDFGCLRVFYVVFKFFVLEFFLFAYDRDRCWNFCKLRVSEVIGLETVMFGFGGDLWRHTIDWLNYWNLCRLGFVCFILECGFSGLDWFCLYLRM